MSERRFVTLAHGNGGRLMRELIETIFARHLANPGLDINADAARLDLPEGEIFVTTDGFTVQPLEFPGGDIGSLAVHGTVNDLAVAGATPLYLTLNAFIEEGFDLADLDRLVASLAAAARADGVRVVAGDTKILRRGEVNGLYLATTGIGVRPSGLQLGMESIREGDRILVSGTVGDHGAAILLARAAFGLTGKLLSDAASVTPLTRAIRDLPGLRFMRDPTRGGLASLLHDIVRARGCCVRLKETSIPIRQETAGLCEALGYDPLYLASEGRVVAVVSPADAPHVLAAWRQNSLGADAAEIGRIDGEDACVIVETAIGGERLVDELEDDPLPRIC